MVDKPVVSIRSLYYSYPDGTPALKGIDLEVAAGERVGVIGPNGAGKSTLFLHLNALIPGGESVTVCGLSAAPENFREIRRRVGLVFENPEDQLFCPTVYEDVAFGPRNMGLPESETRLRVEESLSRVGLNGAARKSPFHLSLGQKKRAAIAGVLSMSPQILALDEPTGSLDPAGKRQLAGLLGGIGGTLMVVSHDVSFVRALCSRVILLSDGAVVADGATGEVLADIPLLKRHGMI